MAAMCRWCPAHFILPFEELFDDPPNPGVDVGQARLDYERMTAALRAREPEELGEAVEWMFDLAVGRWFRVSEMSARPKPGS